MRINAVQNRNYVTQQNYNQQYPKNRVSFGELKLASKFIENISKKVPEEIQDEFADSINEELKNAQNIDLKEILYDGYEDEYWPAIDMVVNELGDKAKNLEMVLQGCSILATADYPATCGQVCYYSKIKHALKPGEDYEGRIIVNNLLGNSWDPGNDSVRLDCLNNKKRSEFYDLHIMPFAEDVYESDYFRIPRCSKSQYSILVPTRELLENHLQQAFEPIIEDKYKELQKSTNYRGLAERIGLGYIA